MQNISTLVTCLRIYTAAAAAALSDEMRITNYVRQCFRDIGPRTYRGHDLDLSRSRDVVDHVTIRFAKCHFLLVVHWNRTSISNQLRDIQPERC